MGATSTRAVRRAKREAKRSFADGGAVTEADKLLARMSAKYGVSSEAPPPPPPSRPAPPPPAPPAAAPTGQGVMRLLRNRGAQIDKAAGYARGGVIRGPGTSTSDSIPAKVKQTGEQINVSTNERILSAKQDKLLTKLAKTMGFDSLDALLEHGTGVPVGPVMKAGKRGALDGASEEDLKNKNAVTNPVYAAGGAGDAQASTNKAYTPGSTQDPKAAAIPSNAAVVGPKFEAMYGNNSADITRTRNRAFQPGGAGDAQASTNKAYTPGGVGDPHGYNQTNAAKGQPEPTGTEGSAWKSLTTDNIAASQSAKKNPVALPLGAEAASNNQGASSNIAAASDADARMHDVTRGIATPKTPTTGPFTQDGRNYTATPTAQEGITRVDSKGTSPLFTNIDPGDAVQGLKGVRSGAPAMTTIDLKGANESQARANAIRQSILDDPNLGGGGARGYTIPDTQRVETQKLFDKWANEALVKQMMDTKGGAPSAAGVHNAYAGNAARSDDLGQAGRNQLAGIEAQGRNQIAGLGVQGQTQRDVAGIQGQTSRDVEDTRGQNHLAGVEKAGQSAREVAGIRGMSDLAVADRTNQGRVSAARVAASEKSLEHLARAMESVSPGSDEYKSLYAKYMQHIDEVYGGHGAGQGVPEAPKLPNLRQNGTTYNTPKGPKVWRDGVWHDPQQGS